jgi:hypothetical protein
VQYRVFRKELYNFGSVYKFIQDMYSVLIPSGLKGKISYTLEDGHVGQNM